MVDPNETYGDLIVNLRQMGGVTVAFSGGVDSTLLLYAAREALGDSVLAVTGKSPVHPESEHLEAMHFVDNLGVRCRVIPTTEMEDPVFLSNPPDRCYHCKKRIFSAIKAVAAEEGLEWVVEGSNASDLDDFRPGMAALKELGIRSPLLEAGLTKADIRSLSKDKDLPTWDKPAMACLATRIPCGEAITVERLKRVERSEEALRSEGLRQVRVRDHGPVARVEVDRDELPLLFDEDRRRGVVASLKTYGYRYVCLDLEGYKTGSLNPPTDREDPVRED